MPRTTSAGAREQVRGHYRTMLGPILTWMLGGDIEVIARQQRDLLESLLEAPTGRQSRAIDLGAGSGAQTLALRRLGFDHVVAIDTDADLLSELDAHASHLGGVETRVDDAVGSINEVPAGSLDACVCMGDTLTHLGDHAEVEQLLAGAARALRVGASLVVTYRDLSPDVTGAARFIPVRSTDHLVMTCFVEAIDERRVEVYDIVHRRRAGSWHTDVGSYPKLRIEITWLLETMRRVGLEIEHQEQSGSGMLTIAAVRRG